MANRDGSLSSFPSSADDFVIKWPLDNDRILGSGQGRNDLQRSDHWNHMFDACLNLEKHTQNQVGGGIVTYAATGGAIGGRIMLLSYQQLTLPGSSHTSWQYNLQVPAIFGSEPFLDWRFNLQPTVYIDLLPSNLLNPAAIGLGVRADGDYRPELTTVQHPHVRIEPTGGRNFKLHIGTHAMHPDSQQIGTLEENCQRPGPTEQLGSKWQRYGNYPAFGIGSQGPNPLNQGSLMYFSSEGDYGSTNNSFWNPNWGVAYATTVGMSADQRVTFAPHSWQGDGLEVGDYMCRALIGLRVSGNFDGSLDMYAVAIGDEALPSNGKLTTGRVLKFTNVNIHGITQADSAGIVASSGGSITSLGTFPLKTIIQNNLPNLRYTFSVSGTAITVREATDGVSYSTVFSTTDSDHTQGITGIFSLPMIGTGSGEKCRRLVFFKYFLFETLSGESPCNLRANILYSIVGPSNPDTQEL